MFTFSGEGVRVNKVFDNKGGITLAIQDTKTMLQADGSFKSVFVCSRLVGTSDKVLLDYIRKNITEGSVVDVSGYMATKAGKKNGEWFDNNIIQKITTFTNLAE